MDSYGNTIQSAFLDNCRLFLYEWARPILDEKYAVFYNNSMDYFIFDKSGRLKHYKKKGLSYVYEVPCYTLALETYVDYYSDREWNETVSHDTCHTQMSYLKYIAGQYWDIRFFHKSRTICLRIGYTPNFPIEVNPIEDEFKNFKIRASKFYKNTHRGSVFLSPTLGDYKCLLRRNKHYIDDNTVEVEYLYDYWNDD